MDTGAIYNESNVVSFFVLATCFITVNKHLMKIQFKREFIWAHSSGGLS